MNINRVLVLLICDTHTHSHLCSALVEKRSRWRRRRIRLWSPCWFYILSFWGIYIEEAFARFFQDKSFCSLFLWVCLSIFQWSCLYAFVMKMKWNTDVLAKHIKIQHNILHNRFYMNFICIFVTCINLISAY